MSKRNGKIEILRFIFCLSVLFFHIGIDVLGITYSVTDHISFFARGRTGVEFFFLVSGFLAAKSAYKYRDCKNNIGRGTYDFILRKIKSILPYHIFAVAISVIVLFFYSDSFIMDCVRRLPSAFLLQRTGINNYDFISVEWYICSMLLALAIIYPLLLKNFDFTAMVLAPVGSAMLIGYLVKTYGQMPLSNAFAEYTYASNMRGLAVVLLGCFCFVVCEKIKSFDFSHFQRCVLIVLENACWIISVFYMFSKINPKYEAYVVYIMAVGVTLTFSRNFNCRVYSNKLVYYLGKLSLPVYLCQNVARDIARNELESLSKPSKLIVITAIALVLGIAVNILCDLIKNRFVRKTEVKSTGIE